MANLGYPVSLRYSRDHEWVETTENSAVVRVGITDFAQEQLGDVVYVDLPEVGDKTTAGESCGEVESTKSVSDLIAPVSGSITEVNEGLDDAPETVNTSPFQDGWMYLVELSDPQQVEALMDVEQYKELIQSEEA
ncbi:MAG: glycine cleavage system protein GcvH [Brevibacterium aurantiacum]|uniref:Glycine cleavage system H protein n=2 Tax=Brevibacterium aurantiacum TaxID=273384 RepID=A0A2A3ZE16_BREAU|nr:glycine cleavage system protein GcvH [Brevibacterium aurantiacum]MDN5593255.1 glycine cleavage system protein GcvH [Brevibacterium sp.]AZT93847.1 glycine cleavage system protein H [Brevibacterium aurantiacum]MDN5659891.1 glycine cleavage system protein GcvH [Brevibacterium aurantiacum]MDN6373221.1 glycine cleavage system protein GcvH [Brevibacterium aurantiacum]MDN6377826.1 glycine cleavage system protein GcvH [Brevibacterium aurantiacum]